MFSVPGESYSCSTIPVLKFPIFSCLRATQRAEYRPKCGLCRHAFLTFVKLRVTLQGSSPAGPLLVERLKTDALKALELDAAESTIVRAAHKLKEFLALQPENEVKEGRCMLV